MKSVAVGTTLPISIQKYNERKYKDEETETT
jgi:hypothetical protein